MCRRTIILFVKKVFFGIYTKLAPPILLAHFIMARTESTIGFFRFSSNSLSGISSQISGFAGFCAFPQSLVGSLSYSFVNVKCFSSSFPLFFYNGIDPLMSLYISVPTVESNRQSAGADCLIRKYEGPTGIKLCSFS